jgi:hypothetical protein
MTKSIDQARRLAEQGAEQQDGNFQLALCEWAAGDGLAELLAAYDVARQELARLRAQVVRAGHGHNIVIDRNMDEPHYWTAVCGGCGWSGTPVEFELEARVQYDLHLPVPIRTDG